MMRPAPLDARFRFPDEHRFTPDRIATEYRMLIRGYLEQMNYLFGTDPRAQEIRDCATRIYELTAALSAHELHKHFHPPQVADPLADLTDLRESHATQSMGSQIGGDPREVSQVEAVSRETQANMTPTNGAGEPAQ